MPRASVGPIELEYEVLGRDGGEPLLLIGGLGSQLISWDDEFCDELVRRGYRIVRYDNRDSGLSTDVAAAGVPDLLGLIVGGAAAPYLLDDLAGDAIGLLDHLEIRRAHVLGLSLGGMIGQLLALDHPERVTSLVAAFSGPPGRPASMPAPQVVQALLRPPANGFDERVNGAVELRRVLAGPGDGFDGEQARRRATAQISRAYRPEGTMRQAAAALASPNRLDDLHRIQVPAMLIHGELDPLIPFASAAVAARAIPGARFVPLRGLGHDMPPAIALDVIERIAEFHRSLTPSLS